jgi:hydroxymethylpyrimidine/phosphomethylpyrimidine kinase
MTKPCVLVLAGNDPSGGAGISADIEAIAAQGAHALPVVTAITVQDNDRVFAVHPVAVQVVLEQVQALANKIPIHAVKLGIIGNQKNAATLALWIRDFKQQHPPLPIIFDPVLASGHGDALAVENAVEAITPLLNVATLITPNLPEVAQLCPNSKQPAQQLMAYGMSDVLIKGGHGSEAMITNSWFHGDQQRDWQWPRLAGNFHGSGCTLASAIAGQLACGKSMEEALEIAQAYCHRSLENAYAIAAGQLIPQRN